MYSGERRKRSLGRRGERMICKAIGCITEIGISNRTGFCKICYARDYRKRNKDKIKPVTQAYYRKNREENISRCKAWRQKNNYSDCKTPKSMENTRIRRRTRYWHPLGDNTCQFCNKPATCHHHTTTPLEVDKFLFLCKKHHDWIHNKQCVVNDAKRGKSE